jgi:hypothetical protein
MNVQFKITSDLLALIRADLRRPHPFAHERVGFISAGLAQSARATLVLARSYRPVADEDYLDEPSVGAMMGPGAIRKAMELALLGGVAVFHVHCHSGTGIPAFSRVDTRESAKFVPDFLKVAPQNIHGSLVLSRDMAAGLFWGIGVRSPQAIGRFVEIGAPMRQWRAL